MKSAHFKHKQFKTLLESGRILAASVFIRQMISIAGAYAYCSEDISKIENYDTAVADKT